jgi:hypothetical protein
MSAGWSWAFNTPFDWFNQNASRLGGTNQNMVISWPARIKDKGALREQFIHLIDVVPTILEVAGIPAAPIGCANMVLPQPVFCWAKAVMKTFALVSSRKCELAVSAGCKRNMLWLAHSPFKRRARQRLDPANSAPSRQWRHRSGSSCARSIRATPSKSSTMSLHSPASRTAA